VIFGYKGGRVLEDVQNILRRPEYEHVALISCTLEQRVYGVKFVEVPRTMWNWPYLDYVASTVVPR